MHIAYVTNVRFPNERAHGQQIQAVTQTLKELGHDITIIAPFRNETKHVQRNDIRYVGSTDFIHSPFFPGILGLWMVNHTMRKALPLELGSFDLLYTRSPALLAPLVASGKPVILELHGIPRWNQSAFVRLCNQCAKVVCLTSPMKEELLRMGVHEDRLIIEGDAIDVRVLACMMEKEQARERFHLPPSAFVVGYAGSFETMGLSKGVDQIIQAVETLHAEDRSIIALLAGGSSSASNDAVRHVGKIPHDDVSMVLAACDVLVYPAPNTHHPYFMRYTSPLKIFEYMAANRPIISADLPPIHDVLDAPTARFYEPGNIQALMEQIQWVKTHPAEAHMMAEASLEKVQSHTWQKRMERILLSIHS
jgi:glycosyltransferase involved in cell wall biosynthesis